VKNRAHGILLFAIVARNIARGLGSTFDTIAPTNGYHPLWMAIISSTPIPVNDTTVIGAALQR